MTHVFYVDGACSLKRNRGGVGVFCEDLNISISLCIDDLFERKTNSISELYAVKHAIDTIKNLQCYSDDKKYIIYSDSKYVVNTFNIWIHGWIRNNWIKKDNKPVLHNILIKEIYDTITPNITIVWTPRENNTDADKLSKLSIV